MAVEGNGLRGDGGQSGYFQSLQSGMEQWLPGSVGVSRPRHQASAWQPGDCVPSARASTAGHHKVALTPHTCPTSPPSQHPLQMPPPTLLCGAGQGWCQAGVLQAALLLGRDELTAVHGGSAPVAPIGRHRTQASWLEAFCSKL